MISSKPTTERKYIKEKKLDSDESGKNKDTSIVYSFSRRTGDKKYWVAKPFGDEFDLSNKSFKTFFNYLSTLPFTENYRIYAAALDVYFGHLASEIFGKEHSPKTKFNLEEKGIVSRVIGNEFAKSINFRMMLKDRTSKFTLTEQKSFLDAVLYGIIIGDRDINSGNLVAQLREDNVNSSLINIYAIDHEFALSEFGSNKRSLTKLFEHLYEHPADIIKFMCYQSLGWNNKKAAYNKEQDAEIYKSIKELLAGALTSGLLIESLNKIVQAILADDYKICYDVHKKIETKISSAGAVYTPFEIEIVTKIIGEAIEKLKSNVEDIEKFLAEINVVKSTIAFALSN